MRSVPQMKDSWEFSAKEFVRGKVFSRQRQPVSVPTGEGGSVGGCRGTSAARVSKWNAVTLP